MTRVGSLGFDLVGTDVVGWVVRELSESGLDDEVGLLVLAALEGDAEFDEYLATGDPGVVVELDLSAEPGARNPGGTFLTSITVEGFRGIGPRATLELNPAPGLTIVAGRNGSGKSSFSEALEYALTGNTYRWKNRTAQWRERWRNLHHPSARIDIGLVEESIGPFTISTEWADGQIKVDAGTTTTQRHGQKMQSGHGDLGWDQALDQFRPILSYDELGGMLSGRPIDLHDALAKVLGTQQLRDALDRLRGRQKQLKSPGAAAENHRKELHDEAQRLEDPRAADVAALLVSAKPDVAAIRAQVTGAYTTEGPIAAMRELASMSSPTTATQAAEVASRLRKAVAVLADASSEGTALRESAVDVATKALAMHAAHGDMTCPVCRAGQLDDSWASSMTALVAKTRGELDAVHAARRDLELACAEARRLLIDRPRVLDAEPLPELRAAVDDARRAWDAWLEVDRGTTAAAATAFAEHLDACAGDLEVAVDILASDAQDRLNSMDQAWQVLGTRIGAWCGQWDAWLADAPAITRLGEATTWLQAAELRLKDVRLEPIRAGAKNVWAKLRHESNVELSDLKLEGAVQRKLVIDSTVDGVAAGGLPVMSQGELHALALALFLPRASMAESPFRFLVLDDPVQAMDPAKVDGLVDVLSGLAKTRQVIVFSHDDRLPAAVRRTDLHASIVEVVRGGSSRVAVEPNSDPATRYLSDAFAFVKERQVHNVDDAALTRVLPGLLRFAVESAARDAYFNPRLAAGESLRDVERAWQDATRTRQRVALAVAGAPGKDSELGAWISQKPHRRTALGAVGGGMHDGLTTDPLGATRAVERLIDDLRRRR